jgi:hypothetical protein
MMRIWVPLVFALCAIFSSTASARNVALDDGLFTTYKFAKKYVVFSVCGKVGGGSGCYGDGMMKPPFEGACAVLEGAPSTQGNVVTRSVYVLDKRTAEGTATNLYVFTRTDTFSENSVAVNIVQTAKIPLSSIGGKKSSCLMAANDSFIYAGTTASSVVNSIDKNSFSVGGIAGEGLSTAVSINADDRGYVAINFQNGCEVVNPSGLIMLSGGGNVGGLSGTRNAWIP